MSDFMIPKGENFAEYSIKKSRFLASVVSIDSREEIKNILDVKAKEHPQARHIVYAFVLGAKGELAGMSDDGEPHGTAGHPILDLLKGRDLTDVLAVVVRYFGGIKLGTGGLVSAYSESVRLALDKLPVTRRIEWNHFSLSIPYDIYEDFRRVLFSWNGVLDKEDFGVSITVDLAIPVENRSELKRDLLNLSRGAIVLY